MTIELLTVDTVAAYLASRSDLAALIDTTSLDVREVGDGNLNLVFIATDATGRSLVLKQSLPYVRMVGESWPLSQDRILAEARGYDAALAHSPSSIPTYHGLDRERRIIVLEDLSRWTVWRRALNDGRISPGAGATIGAHVARTSFGTSVFGRDGAEVKVAAADAINLELCKISEDLIFTQPYLDHPDNGWNPAIDADVHALRIPVVLDEIAELKHRFMTRAEALIHGDLHTGSIFVADGATPAAKVFDIEFSFYGPVGFDLGAVFGNILLAQARAHVLDRPEDFRHWLDGIIGETWNAFESEFRALWPSRVDRSFTDGYLDRWLAETWTDAVGFGAAKAIRRIVGLAKASDIESLPEREHVAAARLVLATATAWLTQRRTVASADSLSRLTAQTLR